MSQARNVSLLAFGILVLGLLVVVQPWRGIRTSTTGGLVVGDPAEDSPERTAAALLAPDEDQAPARSTGLPVQAEENESEQGTLVLLDGTIREAGAVQLWGITALGERFRVSCGGSGVAVVPHPRPFYAELHAPGRPTRAFLAGGRGFLDIELEVPAWGSVRVEFPDQVQALSSTQAWIVGQQDLPTGDLSSLLDVVDRSPFLRIDAKVREGLWSWLRRGEAPDPMGLVPWEDERIDSWWLGQWRQTPGDDFALEWPAIDAEEPQRWILNGPLASDIVPKSSQRLSSQASYGYSGRFEVAPGEQLVFQVRSDPCCRLEVQTSPVPDGGVADQLIRLYPDPGTRRSYRAWGSITSWQPFRETGTALFDCLPAGNYGYTAHWRVNGQIHLAQGWVELTPAQPAALVLRAEGSKTLSITPERLNPSSGVAELEAVHLILQESSRWFPPDLPNCLPVRNFP